MSKKKGGTATLNDVYNTKSLGYSTDYVPYMEKYGPMPYQKLSAFSLTPDFKGGGANKTANIDKIIQKYYKSFKKIKGGSGIEQLKYPDLTFNPFKIVNIQKEFN